MSVQCQLSFEDSIPPSTCEFGVSATVDLTRAFELSAAHAPNSAHAQRAPMHRAVTMLQRDDDLDDRACHRHSGLVANQ